MIKYANSQNFDTQTRESAHQTIVKRPAVNTQRRKATLDFQSANHYVEHLIIDWVNKEISLEDSKSPKLLEVYPEGKSSILKQNGDIQHISRKGKVLDYYRWIDHHLYKQVSQFLSKMKINPVQVNKGYFSLYNRC